MAELKTRNNAGDVDAFLAGVENRARQADAWMLLDLMSEITGEPPAMWSTERALSVYV